MLISVSYIISFVFLATALILPYILEETHYVKRINIGPLLSLDKNIDDLIDDLMNKLNCDNVRVSKFHDGGLKFSVTHSVSLAKMQAKDKMQNIRVSLYANSLYPLVQTGTYQMSDVSKSTDKVAREQMEADGTKSVYLFLIAGNEEPLGFVSIKYKRDVHLMTESEIRNVTAILPLISKQFRKNPNNLVYSPNKNSKYNGESNRSRF